MPDNAADHGPTELSIALAAHRHGGRQDGAHRAEPDQAATVEQLRAEAAAQRHRADCAEAKTERVYLERAHLTALVARLLADRPDARPAVLAYNSQADPVQCPDDWPIIYLELPGLVGQICYHVNPEQLDLFEHVETVAPDDDRARWDYADKDAHHRRIRAFTAAPPAEHGIQ